MALDNKQGNPTKPQVGPNQGKSSPAKAPGDAKPSSTPSGDTVDTSGTPNFLAAGGSPSTILNANGFIGVDPIYQNAANATDRP